MLEARVENALIGACKRHHVLCFKLQFIGRRGAPDRILFAKGGYIGFVECKAPGEKPGPFQRWMHTKLREYGFSVMILDDPDAALDLVEEWLNACWKEKNSG